MICAAYVSGAHVQIIVGSDLGKSLLRFHLMTHCQTVFM